MFKPIVVEAFVILLAGVGYLVGGDHKLAKHPGTHVVASRDANTWGSHPGPTASGLPVGGIHAEKGFPGAGGNIVNPSAVAEAPAVLANTAPPTAAANSSGDAPDRAFNPEFVKTAMPTQQTVADTIPITGRLSPDKQHPDQLQLIAYAADSDRAALKLGQQLSFRAASLPGQSFSGRLSFIAATIDQATRTLQIRCEVPNSQHLLHAQMFVRGLLNVGERVVWEVPQGAVIHLGDSDYIIVRDDNRRYRHLAVTGHPVEPDRYAITGGLTRAMPVVSDVEFLLSQLSGEG